MAKAGGALLYLDGGCNGKCTEVALELFFGEIHLDTVFGFVGFKQLLCDLSTSHVCSNEAGYEGGLSLQVIGFFNVI